MQKMYITTLSQKYIVRKKWLYSENPFFIKNLNKKLYKNPKKWGIWKVF